MKFSLVLSAAGAAAHIIHGRDLIDNQLKARANSVVNLIDPVYANLNRTEQDFITVNLKNLTKFEGDDCDNCKNTLRYARKLVDEQPEHQHLVSLLLFKKCIKEHKGKESKCDQKDFFVTTNSKNWATEGSTFDSGFTSNSSVNFFDNDFLNMLKRFDVDNENDLDYYCYYKHLACELPKIDLDKDFNIELWWPAKEEKHHFEPEYKNKDRQRFNVLHISDVHLQLSYEVGSEANCTTGTCCSPESFNEDLPELKKYNFTTYLDEIKLQLPAQKWSFFPDAAYLSNGTYSKGAYYDFAKKRGYDYVLFPATPLGHYLCDSPELLLNSSFVNIGKAAKEKKFEFSIFTGDLVDHLKTRSLPEYTLKEEKRSFELMKYWFDDMPVLPALGNHDTFPYGQIAPEKYGHDQNYDWNEDLMAELWINNGWIKGANRKEMKKHYAGFTYTTERKLKVIVMNSNTYYQKNLWGFINCTTDPDAFGLWKWIIDELVESEKKGQRVWLMAHIPNNDFDVKVYQSEIFERIVQRFSPYTIAGIFYGHTHRDQVTILYGKDKNPANMAWISQSITPGTNNNPLWRYYEVEDESFNVMNSYNYYLPINETFVNEGNLVDWAFEYSARELYDPKGQWPKELPLNATFWDKYVVQPLHNDTDIKFNQLYLNLQYRLTPFVPKCANGTKVSDKCHDENLCIVSNFKAGDVNSCLFKK